VAIFEQAANNSHNLQSAADLYRADLLTDFQVAKALDFEEWLLVERERYHRLALSVLQRLAGEALQQGRFAEGLASARRLLRLEPWHEDGHQLLMRLLAADGQRHAALAQYETCRAAFAEAFGVAPSPATTALYEAICAGNWDRPQSAQIGTISLSSPQPDSRPPNNLPAAATAFVGRQVEQAQINHLLTKDGCRLITIAGPGGMGKTRLAHIVATEQAQPGTNFSDGVYFVPLAAVSPVASEPNPLASAIAAAIGLSFAGSAAPTSQLLNALRHKKMLLVLDNFEHLIGCTPLIVELLSQSPGLKIIVTARQSLNLFEEWVFDLWGLPYPAEDDNSDLETFDSIRLFAQRAQRVSQSFDLAAELPDVARICRLLAGMPLALEMAAGWVRTITCASIVREIEHNFDFLTAADHVPDRQRSLRTIFDYSWQLLTPTEQTVMARLSVFRAHFTAEAAMDIAQASYPILANLVAKSLLLPCARTERYCVHELLGQYGAEKLPEADALRARHARYFAALCMQQETALRNGQWEAVAIVGLEINNIRAAWQWAIEQADEAILSQLLGTIVTMCELRGWLQEGRDRCSRAIAVVAASSSPQSRLLLGRLEANLARFHHHLGEHTKADQRTDESGHLFERLDTPAYLARTRTARYLTLAGPVPCS
jgi:predicted ATPase